MPPLPADSIHARACKLKCEKILTRPFKKSERIYFAAPPSQITTAALGCDLGSPLCGVFRFCRNIGFNRYLHKNNHTFRCGYFYAYREDFTYPAEVNSACAKVFECPHPIRTVYMRLADRGG